MIEPPVWIGVDVQIGDHARLQGPLVIGDGATIGDGAQLRGSVILPGSTVRARRSSRTASWAGGCVA